MRAAARCYIPSRLRRKAGRHDEFVPVMPSHPQLPPDRYAVVVDECGRGEWIVDVPGHDRPLHVDRLAPTGLAGLRGRAQQRGRGGDLSRALAALSTGATLVVWARLVADVVE